jgi:cob(I)alamin adenosyltransferase
MKIYTRTGDDGTTGLFGSGRVRKDDPRIEACGSLDETNAAIGVVLSALPASAHAAQGWLTAIQNDLFVVGAIVATPSPSESKLHLAAERAGFLEETIDRMESELTPLKNFILPQGTSAATAAHLARAMARRAERCIVRLTGNETVPAEILIYLNRLSDWLFVAARWLNRREGGVETIWVPPSGASAEMPPQADRLSSTLQKLEEEKEKRKTLFEKSASDLEKKRQAAEKLFRSGVDQVARDGGKVEKPLRDMDLD